MAKKKRYRGHYCKVCGRILPNEKFSGKGHAAHICKACAKKPEEKREEAIALNRISRVYRYGDLSRNNRGMLENYSHSPNERIREAATEAIGSFRKVFYCRRRRIRLRGGVLCGKRPGFIARNPFSWIGSPKIF